MLTNHDECPESVSRIVLILYQHQGTVCVQLLPVLYERIRDWLLQATRKDGCRCIAGLVGKVSQIEHVRPFEFRVEAHLWNRNNCDIQVSTMILRVKHMWRVSLTNINLCNTCFAQNFLDFLGKLASHVLTAAVNRNSVHGGVRP